MSISPNSFGSVSNDDREKHKEMILHTLLEERCIHSAIEELNIRGLTKIKHARNDPVIMSLADEKYQFMCKHLRAVGLVNTDSNAEKFTGLRQGYRHGLDFLSKAASSANSDAELSLLADSLQRAGSRFTQVNDLIVCMKFLCLLWQTRKVSIYYSTTKKQSR